MKTDYRGFETYNEARTAKNRYNAHSIFPIIQGGYKVLKWAEDTDIREIEPIEINGKIIKWTVPRPPEWVLRGFNVPQQDIEDMIEAVGGEEIAHDEAIFVTNNEEL